MDRGFDVDLMRDQCRTFPPKPLDLQARSMRIWHCKYRTLDALRQFLHLRILSIASFPDASLEAIGSLSKLEWLSILHLPKVTSLAPLGRLSRLRCLSLQTTPGWDGSSYIGSSHQFGQRDRRSTRANAGEARRYPQLEAPSEKA